MAHEVLETMKLYAMVVVRKEERSMRSLHVKFLANIACISVPFLAIISKSR